MSNDSNLVSLIEELGCPLMGISVELAIIGYVVEAEEQTYHLMISRASTPYSLTRDSIPASDVELWLSMHGGHPHMPSRSRTNESKVPFRLRKNASPYASGSIAEVTHNP